MVNDIRRSHHHPLLGIDVGKYLATKPRLNRALVPAVLWCIPSLVLQLVSIHGPAAFCYFQGLGSFTSGRFVLFREGESGTNRVAPHL